MYQKNKSYYISIEEVIDYCTCPCLYKYKYVLNLKDNHKTILEKYDECIKKCIYNFFHQANTNISISNLKTSFASLWIKTTSLKNIIYSEPTSWRDTHNQKRKQGIESIVKFYNLNKNNIGLPLLVNKPYCINLNSTLNLTGNFEVIREVDYKKDKHIEIVNIISTNKEYSNILLDQDLYITALSLAFRKTFKTKEDIIKCLNVEKGKMYLTFREDKDYKNLYNTVFNVFKCIKNNIFYKCPSKKCQSCAYKTLCLKD